MHYRAGRKRLKVFIRSLSSYVSDVREPKLCGIIHKTSLRSGSWYSSRLNGPTTRFLILSTTQHKYTLVSCFCLSLCLKLEQDS